MKRQVYFSVLMLLGTLASCNESGEIGLNFFDENSFEVSSLDTLTVTVSTVLFDSIPTNDQGSVLVGRHQDAQLGDIVAKGYLQLGQPTDADIGLTDTDIGDQMEFDSITIILDYSDYSIYDTTEQLELSVHLTTEKIELGDDFFLYNVTSFPYETTPLASTHYFPNPLKEDSIEIRLPNSIGEEIFDHLNQNEIDEYLEDFDGLVLIPGTTDNGAIVGFATSSRLRVHYHIPSELEEEALYVDIPLQSTHFSEIQSDRSQTDLADLYEQRYPLNSNETNHRAYIQGGVGLGLRVEIPHITNLREDEDLILSKIYLEFKPQPSQSDNNVYLPPNLSMYEANSRNQLGVLWSTTIAPTIDDELDRGTQYRADITDFIDRQLALAEFNENALIFELAAAEGTTTLNHLYVGDTKAEHEMKLILYYIKVQ